MPLLTLLAVFIFGFFMTGFGSGSGSIGVTDISPATPSHHSAKCSARMKTPPSAGESRRDCGGPPANP
jgi:hypothetical protein